MNNCRIGNVQLAFFCGVSGVFSNFPALCQKDENSLRSCSFVKFFFVRLVVLVFFLSWSIARKYSILQQTGGDTSILRNTLCFIGFDFEGHCIPFFVNLSIVS